MTERETFELLDHALLGVAAAALLVALVAMAMLVWRVTSPRAALVAALIALGLAFLGGGAASAAHVLDMLRHHEVEAEIFDGGSTSYQYYMREDELRRRTRTRHVALAFAPAIVLATVAWVAAARRTGKRATMAYGGVACAAAAASVAGSTYGTLRPLPPIVPSYVRAAPQLAPPAGFEEDAWGRRLVMARDDTHLDEACDVLDQALTDVWHPADPLRLPRVFERDPRVFVPDFEAFAENCVRYFSSRLKAFPIVTVRPFVFPSRWTRERLLASPILLDASLRREVEALPSLSDDEDGGASDEEGGVSPP